MEKKYFEDSVFQQDSQCPIEITSYKSSFPSLSEIDEYTDEYACSVPEACKHYGITLAQYNELSGEVDSQPEIIKDTSLNLGKRAMYLLDALNEFSQYSKIRGFERAALSNDDARRRFDRDGVNNIIESEKRHWQSAEASFRMALGAAAMISAGQDKESVESFVDASVRDFLDKYIGPHNKKQRNQLRKELELQISSIK